MLGENFEEPDHELPMLGIFRRRQRGKVREIAGFALHLVEEARELARQSRRLTGEQRRAAAAVCPFEDETGQEKAPPQVREGRATTRASTGSELAHVLLAVAGAKFFA